MATQFDATAKQLIEIQPRDWLELPGFSGDRVEIVDADLATVTTDADRVIHVLDEPERLVHVEVEAGRDVRNLPQRLARYNALLRYRHNVPVATVVFLLNPSAGGLADVNGYYEDQHPDIGVYVTFNYRVIRIWDVPVERLLAGGVATLPLALLSDMGNTEPREVVNRLLDRASAGGLTSDKINLLLVSAYLMAGLRYPADIAQGYFEGILNMEESSTYQAILGRGIERGIEQGIETGEVRGRANEVRSLILRYGGRRFDPANTEVVSLLSSTASIERLEQLLDRVFEVETWAELFAEQ